MLNTEPPKKESPARGVRRFPVNSFLYDRLVPAALIIMALLIGLIVTLAVLVLLGII